MSDEIINDEIVKTEMTLHDEIIKAEIAPYLEQAKALVIGSREDQNTALEIIKNVKQKWKEIDARLGLSKRKDDAHKKKQAELEVYNRFKDPLSEAEEILRIAIKKFELQEIDRQNREAKQLQAKRVDKENNWKQALEKQAVQAEQSGKTETAAALREEAANLQVAPAFQEPDAPQAEGASLKPIWKARVIDIQAVCKLIGEGKLPITLVTFREAELNRFAEMFHGHTFDGLEIIQDVRVSIRTK